MFLVSRKEIGILIQIETLIVIETLYWTRWDTYI